ncbi:hypothetical protein [Melghirimyces algeriensis]|uniref:hypothetical protein n=1 Tax=Melghirimyces algeriensis TaxID=910412 RepID=UPI00115AD265|nr:hypothetical protein [Melghirimyces algeriensis]
MVPKQGMWVQFDSINVNDVDTASGIFVGENRQNYWSSHNKSNAGFGGVTGWYNTVSRNLNTVDDQDRVDATVDDRDITYGIPFILFF